MDMLTLIDVNVLEDVARKRQDWMSSYATLKHCRTPGAESCVSAWTVAVFYYFREKHLGDARARTETQKAIKGLKVLDFTSDIAKLALNDRRFSGFEDALQFHTARENGIDTFVTRNTRHFRAVRDEITILTPEKFLARMERG